MGLWEALAIVVVSFLFIILGLTIVPTSAAELITNVGFFGVIIGIAVAAIDR